MPEGYGFLEQEDPTHRSDVGEAQALLVEGLPRAGVWVLASETESPVSRLRD